MSILGLERPAHMADEQFEMFARSVGRFLDDHAPPQEVQRWRDDGRVPKSFWRKAGEAGLLGVSVAAEYGGMGGDFRHEVVLMEEIGRRGLEGWDATLHNSIVAPYIEAYGSEAQKLAWLPKISSGEYVAAIAMTEPGTGSDLQAIKTHARRDGDHYVVNGSKTFITNGQNADLVVLAVKTDHAAGAKGVSLIVVETTTTPGFERGRKLDKIGRHMGDTSELFFNDVRVPVANLLGSSEGQGFVQLMEKLPQERLIVAIQAVSAMEYALATTIEYVRDRKAFGKQILEFQNTQFKLAELKTETVIAKVFTDFCTGQLIEGKLDGTTASMAKYWVTDAYCKLVDECVQLHGGNGYMLEYPIGRAYVDARVTRIYGGTNEIMKMLIARSL